MKLSCLNVALLLIMLLATATVRGDLLLHYDMEEASGNLIDRVGALEATPVDTGHTYATAGPTGFGNAISLGANGSWQLSAADSTVLRNLANDFSVAAWVNLDSFLAGGKVGVNPLLNRIIGDDDAWDADGWAMGIFQDGRVRFTKNGIVDVDLAMLGDVPSDEWAHFAATVSSTVGTTLFINGIAVGSNGNTADCITGVGNNGVDDPYGIGRTYGIGEEQWFAGSLDEVKVFDEVLNQAQVQALMVPVRDPALVADIVFDGTGNGVAQTLNIGIENGGETQTLSISGVSLDGTDEADFSVNTLPGDLAPGETGQLVLGFLPSGGKVTYTVLVEIASNDPQRPVSEVTITIEVLDPEIVVAPALDFGQETMRTLTVTNGGGTQDLSLSELNITGANAANFGVAATAPTIPPGGSADLTVVFDPMGGSGVFSAQLEITTNDLGTPVANVALSAERARMDLRTHLVSHFKFDSVAELGDDSGSFDNDGTAVGGASFSAEGKVGGGALLLDGIDGLLQVPGGSEYSTLEDDGDGFTVAAWICLDAAATGTMRIFSTYMPDGFTGNGWGVGMNGAADAGLQATTYGVVDYVSGGTVPSVAEYHHIAYVYRNAPIDTVDFYVDGVQVGSVSSTAGFNDTTTDFCVGSIGLVDNLQVFYGKIDDLRIYDVELVAIDLAQVMEPAPETDLEIVEIVYDGTEVSISWNSVPNTEYIIERSFLDPQFGPRPLVDWDELTDDFEAGEGETTSFTDSNLPEGVERVFYRVKEAP